MTCAIAGQYDWAAKRGFYLNLENTRGDAPKCLLGGTKLALGVADGRAWRFIVDTPAWEFDRAYSVRAVVGPKSAELWLDGKLLGKSDGALAPDPGDLWLNRLLPWANEPADYLVAVESVRIRAGKRSESVSFAKESSRPIPLMVLEPQSPRRMQLTVKAGETVTIEASLRFLQYPDLKKIAPLVDRYGQCRCADWPGKVKSENDIVAEIAEEDRRLKEWGEPKDYDRFGGYKPAGWTEKPAGFYRLAKRDGFWWLISPDGNPCFYTGLCTVPSVNWEPTPVTGREYLFEWLPPKDGAYKMAWMRGVWGGDAGIEYVALHTANLIRKYGEDWQKKALDNTRRRLKAWGFSGVGKWGGMEGMPVTPVLGRGDVPNLAGHPDIFDPEVRSKFKESLRKQIEPRRDDPLVLGWSLGNEFAEIITSSEISEILKKPDATPARRELVEKVPDADIETMRRHYARAYYEFIYRTVKQLDPNHLYFGFWIVPGWWENEEDWRLAAPYCDAVGYDLYSFEFADERLTRLIKESNKPVFCGEFSFPAFYRGQRGFGVYPVWAENDADSGKRYARHVEAAAKNPYCVGLMWFHYRDQPLTGRGAGTEIGPVIGEHYAFGFVDVTDRPKWDLVTRAREANLSAAKRRLEAVKPRHSRHSELAKNLLRRGRDSSRSLP